MQFMGTMAATGMGVDTPPPDSPRRFPALAAYEPEEEAKSDYGADDEDEDDEEIDNSFDYIPESVSSEDFGAGEVRKGGQVPSAARTDIELESVSSTQDVAMEVDVERHTVIQETTVVNKYLHSVGSDLVKTSDVVQQENKVVAVTVSSSAVIDQVTSATQGVGVTETQSRSDSTHSPPSEVSSQHESVVADDVEIFRPRDGNDEPNEEVEHDAAGEISPSEEQEQPTRGIEIDVVNEDEGDAGQCAADGERQTTTITSPAPNQNLPGESVQGLVPTESQEDQHPRTTRVVKPLPLLLLKAPEPELTSTKAAKKKQKSTAPSVPDKQIDSTSPTTSPQRKSVVAPTHTPKRAAAKKRKKSRPVSSGASGDKGSSQLRRSSRLKHEPPRFTYPVKPLEDATVMNHFVRDRGNGVMTCKYCGKEVPASRGVAQRHLKTCSAFTSQEQDDKTEEKAAPPSLAVKANNEDVKMEVPTKPSFEVNGTLLEILMGSKDLAGKLKGAFQTTAFMGPAPISRFQELIRDDVTGLRHLRVQHLLDAVDSLDGQIVLFHAKSAGGRRSTGQEVLSPVSKAKARDMENCPLRFPAPRNVAKQFIEPLAKELGLEYAMHQHTAKLVSCPERGTLLDWRFHKTEMVVFQLGGKALWKTRMGPVQNPLSCYHPDSWLVEDSAEVDKVHRVCTMQRNFTGSLTPPFDELHVFDESESSSEVGEELHEHLLKPGSVAYLPGGTWFEVETKDNKAMWLEVQLEAMTYGKLMLAAVEQLVYSDKQMRRKLQLYPGNRGDAKLVRRRMDGCLKALPGAIAVLDSVDLVPEYQLTNDLEDLHSRGLVHELNHSSASTSFEADLTNPRFKLKHVKVSKDAIYRLNPVAVLRSVDEISHLNVKDEDEDEVPVVVAPHRSLKKSPKPKPKRQQMLRVITRAGKHSYMLDESFGNNDFRSQLHVKFQCSAEQSRVVEWIRSRGSELFGVDELTRDDSVVQFKTSARSEETARHVLRFLCFVGYVSQVNSAKKTPVRRQPAHETT